MNDLDIFLFKEKLINVILNSGTTISTTYYIVKDVLNDLEKIMNQQIKEQMQKRESGEEIQKVTQHINFENIDNPVIEIEEDQVD